MIFANQQNEILAFSHIPKTAGMSIGYLLKRHFGCKHLSVAYRGNDVIYRQADLKQDLSIQPFVRSIAGHSLKPFEDFGDFRLRWYTFLRDPIARFISHYQHEVEKSGKTCNFEKWYQTFRRGNWQVRMLAGEEDLEAAKQILTEKFVFVGLQEYFDESLLMLRSRLRLENFEVRYSGPVNPSRTTTVRESIFGEIEKYEADLVDQNGLDIELYNFVLENIWPNQLQEYGEQEMREDLETCFQKEISLAKRLQFGLNNIGYLSQRNLLYKPFIAAQRWIAAS